jgi:hypothetical protein
MEALDAARFDRSWLQQRLEPDEYFGRLLESSVAKRHTRVREEIETNRRLVNEMWCEGDQLWYWRFRIDGGISGSDGLALLRAGEVFRVWYLHSIIL